MKIYIIRKLQWEYLRFINSYDLFDEIPIKAFLSFEDATRTCKKLNIIESKKVKSQIDPYWTYAQTTESKPLDKQNFFEIVEIELES